MATPASKWVNILGKYLYRNLDSSVKFKISSNMYDVFFLMFYQLRPYDQIPGNDEENDIHEMVFDLNVTTYQNKIRINLLEVTPNNRTIGFDLYDVDMLENLPKAKEIIFNKVLKRIGRAYKDFDFLL